jgi:hypothetical protein
VTPTLTHRFIGAGLFGVLAYGAMTLYNDHERAAAESCLFSCGNYHVIVPGAVTTFSIVAAFAGFLLTGLLGSSARRESRRAASVDLISTRPGWRNEHPIDRDETSRPASPEPARPGEILH